MNTHPDTIRLNRVRAWLTRYDALRAELVAALDDPIPEPPTPPAQPPETTQPPKRPGPDNTGVPAGTKLTWSGTVTLDKPGQILEGLDILGMAKINAPVTLRRCRITASPQAAPSDYPVKIAAGVTGVVLEDCEINGNGRTNLCVGFKGYTLRRCNVHSAAGDLLRADGGCVIERNWLHDFVRVPGGHHDGVQILKGSGVTIRDNTIDMVVDGDPGNACVIISAQAPVSDVLIENNWLNGGNYSLYLGANTRNIAVTNVTARGNTISGWRYGPITARGAADALGNVDHTGKAI